MATTRPVRKRNTPTRRTGTGNVLTAASMRLPDRPDQTQGPDRTTGGFGWQTQCWDVYRNLGMVHYGMSFIRSNVSMIDLYVAEKSDDPDVDLEPLPSDHPAAVELDRIGQGPYGGVSQLLAEQVVFNQVAGEGYLCGRNVDSDDTADEVWEVLSAQELKRRQSGTDSSLRPTVKVRVWRPDPERPTWPDSPLRSVLAECDELILSRRQVRGALLSRLNNGILLLDESLDPSGPAAPGEGDDTMSPLLRDIWQAFSTAIQEPEAATQVMPYLLMGNGVKDKVEYLQLDRPFDGFAIELRDDLTRAIAAGLDLPAERLLGLDSSNHWCVDDQTEALTIDRGWVTHDQLNVGDTILTLNHDTGESEWQPIEDMYQADVTDEPMVKMANLGHSSLTTPNHRWPVIDGNGNRVFRTTSTLRVADKIITAAPVSPVEQAKHSDDLVELVAWFWAEGNINASGSVSISQSHTANPEKCARLRRTLTRMFGATTGSLLGVDGPAWREAWQANLSSHGGPITVFYLNKAASDILIDVAPAKRPTMAFLTSLTPSQLALFAEVCELGDGHHAGRGDIWQKDPTSCDAYEVARILGGHMVTRTESESGWRIQTWNQGSVRPRKAAYEAARIGSGSGAAFELEQYTGVIWCPVTGNSTWLSRRDGKVAYTGNTAWLIDDSTYSQHLAPAVNLVVDAWQRDLLTPAWQAAGLDPDRFVLLSDATDLTSRVRKGADAVLAFDRGVLSEDALRRELGFDDGDRPSVVSPGVGGTVGTAPAGADTVDGGMPDEPGTVPAADVVPALPIEELKDRAEVFGILFRAGVTPETAAQAAGIAGLEFTGDEPVTLREPGDVSASGLVLTAATDDDGDDPVVVAAWLLAAVDAAVLARLEREVSNVHDRVVAETEGRLRGLLAADGVDTAGMAAVDLARAVAESGVNPATAVPDGAYGAVAATAGAVLARGQDDAHRVIATLAEGVGQDAPVRDDTADSAALAAAVGGLVGGLTGWLREKLFTTAGADPDVGELLSGRVDGLNPPLSLMVEAATVAGGGQGVTVGSVGVANGAQVESWLDALAVSTTGWVWQYGDPGMRASQFEPHRRLDGVEFSDWESDVLAHSGWPGSRLAPQDHRGCGCGAARILQAAAPAGSMSGV